MGISPPRGDPPSGASAMKLGELRKVPEAIKPANDNSIGPVVMDSWGGRFGLFLRIGYSSLILVHSLDTNQYGTNNRNAVAIGLGRDC